MAQLVISAAGATAGFFLGGPTGAQIGWAAGSALGSALFPRDRGGPRLSDLKVSGSAYGSPIPYVEGHPRVPAQVIWASDKYAVSAGGGGGKGGPSPSVEGTIYKVDILVLVSANEISGIRRWWSNGKLVSTAADDASADSLQASAVTPMWDELIVYGGDAAQLPDPTYEAAVGSGNAPAYRGRGTALIRGLNLGTGGQLPNLTCEISTGSINAANSGILSAPLTTDGNDIVSPAATLTTGVPGNIAFGPTGATITNSTSDGPYLEWTSGTKLTFSDPGYAGETITVRAAVSVASTTGSGTGNSLRFLDLVGGTKEAAWTFRMVSGVVHHYAYYYISPGSPVSTDMGTSLGTEYAIVFDADGVTTHWYCDGVLMMSQAGLGSSNFGGATSIFVQLPASASPCVRSILARDVVVYVGELFEATTYGNEEPTLEDVVVRQCERGGLASGQVAASALAGLSVRALAVSQVTAPRAVLEMLMSVYAFEAVETGGKIKFVLRGGSSAATLPYADLGATTGNPVEPLPLNLANDVEAPAQITLRYANVNNDYQDGAESSDRLLGPGLGVRVVEAPIGLTPAEARAAADVAIMDAAAAWRSFGPVAVSNDYARLEPTDVVTLTDVDGATYRARILKARIGALMTTLEGTIEDASILASAIATTDDYASSSIVASAVDTVLELLDIPLLRDDDDGPGFYAAMKGAASPWPGCALYGSPDEVTYTLIDTISEQTQIGTCTTTLGAWSGGAVFDETNSVTVNVGEQTLASWSRADILSGAATGYVVGSELLYARTATYVSPGVYTLSGLLRGRRGTEWAMASHGASERFVALPATGRGLRRVALATTDLGVTRYYKAVTIGRALGTATAQTLSCAGVSQKPFAPVDLRKTVSDSAVTVTWKRRTRYATRFAGAAGISTPLGETSESYVAELRDGSNVLVSSETVTSPEWSNGSAAVVGTLEAPMRSIASIGGELVGIRDDELLGSLQLAFVRQTPAPGSVVQQSPAIGWHVYQWAAAGDELYAAVADINYAATPSYYTAGRVVRYTRGDLSAAAATYTAATAGDPAGVACDGTDVWMTERSGNNLRKLNASTLASTATYAMGAELGALVHDAGTLWICSIGSDEVVQWDIATTSELLRFSVAYRPMDVLVASTTVWVLSAAELAVYDKTTGALVAVAPVTPVATFAGKTLCEFDGDIAAIDVRTSGQVVALLDIATGALLRSIDPADPYIDAISGVGSLLYMTTRTATRSARTAAYELAAPGLSGYSLTVAQRGAIGAGYGASIAL